MLPFGMKACSALYWAICHRYLVSLSRSAALSGQLALSPVPKLAASATEVADAIPRDSDPAKYPIVAINKGVIAQRKSSFRFTTMLPIPASAMLAGFAIANAYPQGEIVAPPGPRTHHERALAVLEPVV